MNNVIATLYKFRAKETMLQLRGVLGVGVVAKNEIRMILYGSARVG
jgi:hypothetical protein